MESAHPALYIQIQLKITVALDQNATSSLILNLPSSHICVLVTSRHAWHDAVSMFLIMLFFLPSALLPSKSILIPHLFQLNYYIFQEPSFVLLVRMNLLFSCVVTTFYFLHSYKHGIYIYVPQKALHRILHTECTE